MAFPAVETTPYNLGDFLTRPLQVSVGFSAIMGVMSAMEQTYETAELV